MRFRTQLRRIEEEFARVGVAFGVPDLIGGVLLCVRTGEQVRLFRAPHLDATCNYRVPGWLLAGIWDLLALPSREYLPTDDDLRRTQFRRAEPGLWVKALPADARQQLLYRPATGRFSTRRIGHSAETPAGSWPRTSLFHAQRLFEANNWVSPHEVAVPPQDAARWLISPRDSLMSLCTKALPPAAPPAGPEASPAGSFQLFELRQAQSAPVPQRPTLPVAQEDVRWAGPISWLYQTPEPLRTQLTDRQVALWQQGGAWALSTRVASVLLAAPPAAGPPLDFQTVHPAKSAGYLSLFVGDLVLYDAYDSPVLPQLLSELLARTAGTPRYLESYDC